MVLHLLEVSNLRLLEVFDEFGGGTETLFSKRQFLILKEPRTI